MDTKALQQIKDLHATAAAIGGYFAKHKKTISDPRVDKHEARFDKRSDRFCAFNVTASFTCHTGVYGSSSCGVDLYARTETVEPYFIRAMAKHQELLFATAAELMRDDAAKLSEKARAELAALTAMVDGLEAPAEPELAA